MFIIFSLTSLKDALGSNGAEDGDDGVLPEKHWIERIGQIRRADN